MGRLTPAVRATPALPTPSARTERGDARAERDRDPEPVAAERAQALGEETRVAARIAEISDRPRDPGLHRLEGRLELRHAARIQDLLLLPVLGEQRHLLDTRRQLGRIAIEIERFLRDRVVLDTFRGDELAHHPPAVLAEAELHERVASRARRGALAQEAQAPRVEMRVGPE